MSELLTAIDLGTSKICVIICKVDRNGQVQIVGVGNSPCSGIRKGIVVDIEDTCKAISYAVQQAENMADVEISDAYISIPGGYTKLVRNKGIIAVSGENKEIDIDDVKRVLNSSSILPITQNKRIIDIIPFQYIIDGYDEIKDPIGMVGIRLEADVDIVIGSSTTVLNLVKSVNESGIEVLGITPEPFAQCESILTKDEKELGVLLIDIGAGTTDISLFINNQMVYSKLINIAGNHITNDISVGLRISYEESEEIKRVYGIAYTPLADKQKIIKVTPIGMNQKKEITQLQLSQIIEARIEELFELIDVDLVQKDIKNNILAGIVITGGGVSYFKGIDKLGSEIFGLPIRIGQPKYIGVEEPIYSTSVGLINYSLKRKFNYFIEYNNVENKKRKANKVYNNSIFSFFKKIWKEYF